MDNNEIIKAIQNKVRDMVGKDKRLSDAYAKVRTGQGTWRELYKYEELLAEATNYAIGEVLVDEVLTPELEGRIGTEIIAQVLGNGYDHLINLADGIERAKLRKIKVNFNPVKPGITETRVKDIVAKYNIAVTAEDIKGLTAEKIINQFYGASLDEFCEANANFQYEAGLSVSLVRVSGGQSCPFCEGLAGVYEYDGTPECGTGQNLFARHTGCTCTIDVRTSRGKAFERVNNYRR